jgi:hypothetical protein
LAVAVSGELMNNSREGDGYLSKNVAADGSMDCAYYLTLLIVLLYVMH